jgi:hypothetical protein
MSFTKENAHQFIQIAEKIKKGISPNIDEEMLIAVIMSHHPEFDPIWPLGDMSTVPQEINGQVVNPFVHTALHLVIEKQIEKNDPAEVNEAMNLFLKKGIERHEVLHQIGGIYANIYFSSFRKGEMFEEYSYLELLREMTKTD